MNMKALGVIPARLGSSRFPGKPLAEFFGKTMVEHTYEAANASKKLNKVIVASDSEKILRVIDQLGGETKLTGECDTGTDRVVQVLHSMDRKEFDEYDVVVNIQGDEPGVNPRHIDACVVALREDQNCVMSTLATPITNEKEARSNDVVKCVVDANRWALVLFVLILY
jgi:3-deoxy-manno-octulosonate cytidylyltransferase (CMP-KDO synthetase)